MRHPSPAGAEGASLANGGAAARGRGKQLQPPGLQGPPSSAISRDLGGFGSVGGGGTLWTSENEEKERTKPGGHPPPGVFHRLQVLDPCPFEIPGQMMRDGFCEFL